MGVAWHRDPRRCTSHCPFAGGRVIAHRSQVGDVHRLTASSDRDPVSNDRRRPGAGGAGQLCAAWRGAGRRRRPGGDRRQLRDHGTRCAAGNPAIPSHWAITCWPGRTIGWVAVGDPARLYPPAEAESIRPGWKKPAGSCRSCSAPTQQPAEASRCAPPCAATPVSCPAPTAATSPGQATVHDDDFSMGSHEVLPAAPGTRSAALLSRFPQRGRSSRISCAGRSTVTVTAG